VTSEITRVSLHILNTFSFSFQANLWTKNWVFPSFGFLWKLHAIKEPPQFTLAKRKRQTIIPFDWVYNDTTLMITAADLQERNSHSKLWQHHQLEPDNVDNTLISSQQKQHDCKRHFHSKNDISFCKNSTEWESAKMHQLLNS